MTPFEIRLLPIERLVPAPYNPRRPLTAKARKKLKASLAEFGLVEPLVWNERTGHVVGGHARLDLLRELGHAAVPVSVVNLDDARERALNVVLNNLEAQGRYDPAKLLQLLTGLGDGRDLTGFDDATLRNLQLEPEATEMEELPSSTLEVTLVIESPKYDAVAPRLDELVREFDLVSHVKSKSI